MTTLDIDALAESLAEKLNEQKVLSSYIGYDATPQAARIIAAALRKHLAPPVYGVYRYSADGLVRVGEATVKRVAGSAYGRRGLTVGGAASGRRGER